MKTSSFLLLFLFTILPVRAEDEELKTYQAELSRALRSKHPDSLATAYCHLSEYYAYRNSDSARHYCEEGLKHARREVCEPYLVLLNNLAEAYSAAGEMEQAASLYKHTLTECIRLHSDSSLQATVSTSLGVVYRRRDMPDSALYFYNRGLALLRGQQAYDEEAHLLTNIAVLYANTSRLEEAERYALLATEAAQKCEDMDMVIYAANTAGVILTLCGKNEEAISQLYPALAKALQQGKPRFILKGVTYLLGMFHRMNQPDSINHYMTETEKLIPLLPENSAEVQGYRETLYQILSRMGRYDESLAIQKQLLASQGQNTPTPIDRLYLFMARNYDALGNHRQAAAHYELAYQAADSLHNAAIETELSEFSVKYETYKKELEIARLNEERLRQESRTMRWTAVAVAALSLALFIVLLSLFRRRRLRKEEELKMAQSYIEGMEKERARLAKDLHDGVCNDLLGIGLQIQLLTPGAEIRQVLALVEQTREEVRSISHELMPPSFKNTTPEEIIEAYIERLSLPKNMKLSFEKDIHNATADKIPEHTAYEIYRILQEALSNILKYAQATRIGIRLKISPDRLILSIENNGKEYNPEHGRNGGVGLDTMRERAKTIGATLRAETDERGQKFHLEVPLPHGKP